MKTDSHTLVRLKSQALTSAEHPRNHPTHKYNTLCQFSNAFSMSVNCSKLHPLHHMMATNYMCAVKGECQTILLDSKLTILLAFLLLCVKQCVGGILCSHFYITQAYAIKN